MAKGKLFLVALNPIEAERWRPILEQHGWQLDMETDDHGRAYDSLMHTRPNVLLIDLDHQPAAARKVARSIRMEDGYENLPIVFVNGEPEERELGRIEVKDAGFATDSDVASVLNRYAR
jgi:DNA-binding response OmpR family regulator